MTLSRFVLYSSVAFIGGVFVSSFIEFRAPALLLLAALSAFFVTFFWQRSLMVGGAMILLACLGVWRQNVAQVLPEGWDILGREVSFSGQVRAEPDRRENGLRLEIQPDSVESGLVLVFTDRFFEVGYGDRVHASGFLEVPEAFGTFDYPSYLKSQGVYGLMFRPVLKVIEKGRGPLAWVFSAKERLREEGRRLLSPEASYLLGAMALGDKDRMPDALKDRLSAAGVRHITAVSGMHVAILSSLLLFSLLKLGMWRRQALFVVLLLIISFVVFTGLQPSAVRAGVMGSMLVVGQAFHRASVSLRALVFAATLMLAFNPLLLLHDSGFQLSFLAVLGIIGFAPFFSSRLRFLPSFVCQLMALSLSAQMLTLPLVAYSFGAVSLSSFAANLALVPLVPFVFALGIPFYVLSPVFSQAAELISLPLSFLLSFFSFVIDLAASFPLVGTEHFPVFLLPAAYAFLWAAWRRVRPKEFFLTHPSGTISEW